MPALTLDLVKRYLGYEVEAIDHDPMLEVALEAGIDWVETYTDRTLRGADPATVPPVLLHGVLLYAGAFERMRDEGVGDLLKPAELVCWQHRKVAV